jgi:hypothetical protein
MWKRRSLQRWLGSDNYVVKNAEPRTERDETGKCVSGLGCTAFGVLAMAAKSKNSEELK